MADGAFLDRAAGVLVGLAAGDALGAGYEFARPPDGDAAMIGGGLGPWAPGEWTDDTQMALCIAQVAASGTFDVAAVGDGFIDWYRGRPKDIGILTSGVLSVAERGRDLPAAAVEHRAKNPNSSASNGSLMRTAPVALAHLGDDAAIAEAAAATSALTHVDHRCVEACVLWCIAIDRAVREERLDGLDDGLVLLEPDARDRWATWLEDAATCAPSDLRPNGYVVRALQAAWAAILRTPVPDDEPHRHLEAALHAAVRIGDDTDTVAAIAGALLGARWGASAVPEEWRSILHGWPGLDAGGLTDLAQRIVTRA